MATNAVMSAGTQFFIKTTGTTYVQVKEFKDFSGVFSGSAAVIDVTHLDSVAKEKLLGVTDEGSYKLTFNYVANDLGTKTMIDRRATSTLADLRLVLVAAKKQLDFKGYVLTSEITGGVDKPLEFAPTIEVTGAVTITDVTP